MTTKSLLGYCNTHRLGGLNLLRRRMKRARVCMIRPRHATLGRKSLMANFLSDAWYIFVFMFPPRPFNVFLLFVSMHFDIF